MLAPEPYKSCGNTPRSMALLSLWTAVRLTLVCLAIVCCWADVGEPGEETAGDRYFALVVPCGGDADGPDAVPETPALPASQARRAMWLQGMLLASVNRVPTSFLPTAQPNPRSPPPPIATHGPARSLPPVFIAA